MNFHLKKPLMAMVLVRRVVVMIAGATLVAARAHAQTTSGGMSALPDVWRLSASAGSYVPRSPIIVGADGRDTRFSAGPSFALDAQYMPAHWVSIYANGTAAFSTVALGTAIQPGVVGPSNNVTLMGATAGIVLAAPISEHVQPTLRLGGGFKGYSFNLKDVDKQWRPTGDVGIGVRGIGTGPIEVSAEVRYLPSTIDQSKLPTRGIVTQQQRQTDLIFGIGVSIRQ